MPLEKTPFRSYTLDEDKPDPMEKGKIFTIRLNAKEYQEIKEFMKILSIKRESTTIKFLAQCGKNVLHNTFCMANLKWILSTKRKKEEIE